MRSLAGNERVLFWIFFFTTIISNAYWNFCYIVDFIEYQYFDILIYVYELISLLSYAQFVLLFVKRFPKALYCIIGGIVVVFFVIDIIVFMNNITSEFDSINYYTPSLGVLMRRIVLESSLIPELCYIAGACLMIILKFRSNIAVAITALIIWAVNNIWFFGRAIYWSIYDIFYLDGGTIVFNWLLYRGGTTLGYILLIIIVKRSRRCICGCINKTGAKFCGGCGRTIEY